MKSTIVSVCICVMFGSVAWAGGDHHDEVLPECNAGHDGNRECKGDKNNPPSSGGQAISVPKTSECPESFKIVAVTDQMTIRAVGMAKSSTDPGFGPSMCNYKVTSLKTSKGVGHAVNLAAMETSGQRTWIDFTVSQANYRLSIESISGETRGGLSQLRTFDEPYDLINSEALNSQESELNISSDMVTFPNIVN